ncbi:hypothetical protein H0A58_02875 [Alcaligenaceae bacterium]|nr:hypothetical protein [Alcaligenaceae bacterium]
MLPLQASWGVVSVYCQQEVETCVSACGVSGQDASAQALDTSKQTSSGLSLLDQYEHSCHAPVVMLASSQLIIPSFSTNLGSRFHEARLSLLTFSERPERPQWFFAA